MGRFGQFDPEERVVRKCSECGVGFLVSGAEIDYESSEYRDLVNGEASAARYYEVHDADQAAKLDRLGPARLRGKVVMDVGCGAGSFLDLVKGYAAQTVAIEPSRSYHPTLRSQGHQVFSFSSDALSECEGQVDAAVCFSVIEHVPDPVSLLRDVRRLLRPGGEILLSTPNAADWLLELLPDAYAPFFYRVVHQWYFDHDSVQRLASEAGFARAEVSFAHNYDLSNVLLWLRDRKPTGRAALPVWPVLDSTFRQTLESAGRSDYLYARLFA